MEFKLIECPACGNEVSTQAAACPKCGHPIAVVKALPRNEAPSSKSRPLKLSLKEIRWSPMGNSRKQGPSSTYAINNVPLSQDAILHRIRHVFEQNGFSAIQSEYREGIASTIGGVVGGEGGGLVGGITALDKKTWNPFLVSKPGHRFMRAKVTVLSICQKSRMVQDGLSQTENDIELQVKIDEPNLPTWMLFPGALIGMMVGITVNLVEDGSNDRGALYGLIGSLLGMTPFFAIAFMAWNETAVMDFRKELTEAMLKVAPKLNE